MASYLSNYSTPATTITTTTETLAQNIPASPIVLPLGSPQQIIVRGMVWVTTGAATASVTVKLRVGQSNTTTAQVGNSAIMSCNASTLQSFPFHFIDTSGQADLSGSGYSITVTQTSATGNGTVTAVTYEVDYSEP